MNVPSAGSTNGDDPPISWASATSIDGGAGEPSIDRRLGFPAAALAGLVPLPDDVEAMAAAITAGGSPFNGAFVPVVVHDTIVAERSYDAAEWAADLIRTGGGRLLAVTTVAEPDWDGRWLNARQWNHAAAMIERLAGVCQRFGLRMIVRETIGGVEIDGDDELDQEGPIGHLLDTGRFVDDDLVPVELVCPQRPEADGGLVERVRDLLRDRT